MGRAEGSNIMGDGAGRNTAGGAGCSTDYALSGIGVEESRSQSGAEQPTKAEQPTEAEVNPKSGHPESPAKALGKSYKSLRKVL